MSVEDGKEEEGKMDFQLKEEEMNAESEEEYMKRPFDLPD